MSSSKVEIGNLADAVMKELDAYAKLSTDGVKTAVKQAAKTVQTGIKANAPLKTGVYAKSWTVKTTRESANALELTVHSRNRYQIAHLLEHGHAKRGGGRVPAQVHIAPAEEAGIAELEQEIERYLTNG